MEAIRACRLVVDTGMHAKGWTLQQALEYMLQNTAMGRHDASAEVTRYVWPGQACGYKIGQLEIQRLRSLAETELGIGELFDKRDFYDVVLKCGPVPLDTLETLVKNYIANTKANNVVMEERVVSLKHQGLPRVAVVTSRTLRFWKA